MDPSILMAMDEHVRYDLLTISPVRLLQISKHQIYNGISRTTQSAYFFGHDLLKVTKPLNCPAPTLVSCNNNLLSALYGVGKLANCPMALENEYSFGKLPVAKHRHLLSGHDLQAIKIRGHHDQAN